MAVFVATDYKITINGTNFSANLTQAELSQEAADVETTAFGSGWTTRVSGLKSASLTLSFNQDFGASSVDATLSPLLGSLATVTMVPVGTNGTSATNPVYSGTFLVTQYTPFSASIGDLATLDVTWPASGTVSRATA
jgi:hypothetical protein